MNTRKTPLASWEYTAKNRITRNRNPKTFISYLISIYDVCCQLAAAPTTTMTINKVNEFRSHFIALLSIGVIRYRKIQMNQFWVTIVWCVTRHVTKCECFCQCTLFQCVTVPFRHKIFFSFFRLVQSRSIAAQMLLLHSTLFYSGWIDAHQLCADGSFPCSKYAFFPPLIYLHKFCIQYYCDLVSFSMVEW